MNQVVGTVKLPSGSLASRQNAKPFRFQILQELSNHKEGIVNIDLSDVKTISGSFADECIGVLVLQIGFENLLKRIRLINGSQNVVRSIAEAIRIRKSSCTLKAQ